MAPNMTAALSRGAAIGLKLEEPGRAGKGARRRYVDKPRAVARVPGGATPRPERYFAITPAVSGTVA